MKYPAFLKPGDTVGITAPSDGVGSRLESYLQSVSRMKELGCRIKETASVRSSSMPSASAKKRARELESLFRDPSVKLIQCAAGGDFLYDMLFEINWDVIRRNPKWIIGASDPSSLLLILTSWLHLPTLYGFNAADCWEKDLYEYEKISLEYYQGNLLPQSGYDFYSGAYNLVHDISALDRPACTHSNRKTLHVSGRCIGGCIDTFKDLVGTPLDRMKQFNRFCSKEGLIFYIDNYAMSAENLYRTLLQLKSAGWFDSVKAFLVGRTLFESSVTGMSYADALNQALPGYPIVYDADIGHTDPHFILINGAMMEANYRKNRLSIRFELK